MIRRIWVLCLSVVCLFACGENVAGGTSEHENVLQVRRFAPPGTGDRVAAIVLDSAGVPIPHAVVQMVERRNWAEKTAHGEKIVRDSAFIADEKGMFYVDSGLCAHVGLVVNAHGKGLGYAPCAQAGSISKIHVERARHFRGKGKANQVVAAYGTGFFAKSDASGKWRLPLPGSLRKSDIVLWENGDWHLFGETDGRISVEDFSDGNSPYTLLHRFNGESRWWAAFESDSLNDSTRNLPRHRVFADEIRGNALHIDLTDVSGGKAMVGFNWGADRTHPDVERIYRDLSRADTLFFAAKGRGTIRVQFICRAEDLLKNTVLETKISLDSAWKDYALPIQEFQTVRGSTLDASHSWDEVSGHCKATAFYAMGSADLWLDDIAIHGVLLKDLE